MAELSTEQLVTTMGPLVVSLERALERQLKDGAFLPTAPVPRIQQERDGGARLWTGTVIDWRYLRRVGMDAMTGPSNTFVAEAVVAEALGTGPHEQAGSERAWTPQGQVVDVFLELFLERAYSDAGDRAHEDPFADHGDDPLIAECERLADFLATEHFEGQLIAPLRDFRMDGEALQLTEGVNIVTVEWSWFEALWAEHGWGGPSTQPLQSHDLYGYGHALSVAVGGQKLGGWDWAAASPLVERALSALRLTGPGSVATPFVWLSLPTRFAPYLSRLGTSGGLLRPDSPSRRGEILTLTQAAAESLPRRYVQLAGIATDTALGLAVRRLESSYKRASGEDRIIDAWIAFEALFTPERSPELRFRACLRIARYVGSDRYEREQIFADMKRSYDWRSHIVHGGGQPAGRRARELGPLPDTVAATEETLRRALVKWLDEPPQAGLGDIDAGLLA